MTFKTLHTRYEARLKELINNGYEADDENVEELATALMAIRKQAQMRLIVKDEGTNEECRYCPVCAHNFVGKYVKYNYCPECGQKVKA